MNIEEYYTIVSAKIFGGGLRAARIFFSPRVVAQLADRRAPGCGSSFYVVRG